MKQLFAALILMAPIANAHAGLFDFLRDVLKPPVTSPPPSSSPAPAPEIDGGSATLAFALAGGCLVLLKRSRRKQG